jgi:hypothetical protein
VVAVLMKGQLQLSQQTCAIFFHILQRLPPGLVFFCLLSFSAPPLRFFSIVFK